MSDAASRGCQSNRSALAFDMTGSRCKPKSAKFVRDVLGEPDSWPNFMHEEWQQGRDMRGAIITVVFAAGDQIAVQTKGAICGETFSTFVVEEQELRDRVMQILRPELSVYAAVATAL
jgi:hypothetical protein